ncbi:MAG: FAD:protein FMN transferase [Leptothrix sp. (in: b-proteobacteria)]
MTVLTPAGLDHAFRAMGSPCRIHLGDVGARPDAAQRAVRAAVEEVARIERKFSRYRADSIVSRINAAAGTGRPVRVDAETAELLGFAAQLHAESDGLFDITSGVLRRAWDFGVNRLPSPEAIKRLLPLVDWRRVCVDGHEVRLPAAGMELDFGGFGKEYAADRAATLLMGAGFASGFVNLGGDIRLLGPRPDGSPWTLGIAHPRVDGGVIAELALTEGALATSGDYERYLEHAGQRYCHILDPRTGWPVSHWQSVSVVAPACLAAGALSTIAMLVQGDAASFLDEQGVQHVLIDACGQVRQRVWPLAEN